MIVDDEKNVKSSKMCWTCNTLYAEGDNKVRDHDRHRVSAYKICNMNLRLTKKNLCNVS